MLSSLRKIFHGSLRSRHGWACCSPLLCTLLIRCGISSPEQASTKFQINNSILEQCRSGQRKPVIVGGMPHSERAFATIKNLLEAKFNVILADVRTLSEQAVYFPRALETEVFRVFNRAIGVSTNPEKVKRFLTTLFIKSELDSEAALLFNSNLIGDKIDTISDATSSTELSDILEIFSANVISGISEINVFVPENAWKSMFSGGSLASVVDCEDKSNIDITSYITEALNQGDIKYRRYGKIQEDKAFLIKYLTSQFYLVREFYCTLHSYITQLHDVAAQNGVKFQHLNGIGIEQIPVREIKDCRPNVLIVAPDTAWFMTRKPEPGRLFASLLADHINALVVPGGSAFVVTEKIAQENSPGSPAILGGIMRPVTTFEVVVDSELVKRLSEHGLVERLVVGSYPRAPHDYEWLEPEKKAIGGDYFKFHSPSSMKGVLPPVTLRMPNVNGNSDVEVNSHYFYRSDYDDPSKFISLPVVAMEITRQTPCMKDLLATKNTPKR